MIRPQYPYKALKDSILSFQFHDAGGGIIELLVTSNMDPHTDVLFKNSITGMNSAMAHRIGTKAGRYVVNDLDASEETTLFLNSVLNGFNKVVKRALEDRLQKGRL